MEYRFKVLEHTPNQENIYKHNPIYTNKMKTIVDPKENKIKVKTKSVLISKKRGKTKNEFPTLRIRLFNVNNPHKTQEFPHTIYEFTGIEKSRIRRLNMSYYLEGPHIVVNDLEEIYINKKNNKLEIKGYQIEVEQRRENHKK